MGAGVKKSSMDNLLATVRRAGNGRLTFCMYLNTVATGANVIFSLFDKSLKVCFEAVPDRGFEGYFRLSAFGHREYVIETVERIKKNLK